MVSSGIASLQDCAARVAKPIGAKSLSIVQYNVTISGLSAPTVKFIKWKQGAAGIIGQPIFADRQNRAMFSMFAEHAYAQLAAPIIVHPDICVAVPSAQTIVSVIQNRDPINPLPHER